MTNVTVTNATEKPNLLCLGDIEVGTFFYLNNNLWIKLSEDGYGENRCYNFDIEEEIPMSDENEVFEADVQITATIKY